MTDFLRCDLSHLTMEDLLPALLTKTANGEWAFRTMIVDGCADDAINCSNNAIDFDSAFKNCIGIDPGCGKPAIRLASNTFAGIRTFANDAAAAAATPAVPVGGIYYKTGVGLVARTV